MESGYTRSVSIFAPDGTIPQIEHAKMAAMRGTPLIVMRPSTDVFVLFEAHAQSRYQVKSPADRLCRIAPHIYCIFSGLQGDADALAEYARIATAEYEEKNACRVSGKVFVRLLEKHMNRYTRMRGRRPYGVACIAIDIREDCGFYVLEADGVARKTTAIALGAEAQRLMKSLEKNTETYCNASPEFVALKTLIRGNLDNIREIHNLCITRDGVHSLENERLREVYEGSQ